MYSDTSIRETSHIVMMPFRCFPEVPDGILSLFLVCGKQSFPPLGKVPGIPAKTVHFPPWQDGVSAPQASLAALGISTPWGKCREFPRKRFTFPRGEMGHRLHRPLSRHLAFPPPGKVPDFSAKTVHFPLVVSSVTCPTRTLLSLTNCHL